MIQKAGSAIFLCEQGVDLARILVVDDDSGNRRALERLLGMEDYDVVTAENGQEGARVFRENADIRLVLSDVNMPVMTGPEMHREIAEEIRARDVRFGFMSAGYMSAADKAYLDASGIPVLPKPSGVEMILTFVCTLLAT